jgi:hypothetical protein
VKWLLGLVLAVGCASQQRIETARVNLDACEATLAAHGQGPNAAKIAADCAAWRLEYQQAANAQEAQQMTATVLSGIGSAHREAGTKPRGMSCTSMAAGNMVYTDCY